MKQFLAKNVCLESDVILPSVTYGGILTTGCHVCTLICIIMHAKIDDSMMSSIITIYVNKDIVLLMWQGRRKGYGLSGNGRTGFWLIEKTNFYKKINIL